MAKVLLWGPALWSKTGYGKNMLNLGLRLKEAGHEVAQFAFGGLRWGQVEYEGVKIFPNGADDYGQTWLPRWHKFFGSDIIIWHYDAWVLGSSFKDTDLPICFWSPMDHSPVPPPLKESLEGQKVIAICRFAQREFERAGIKSVYIPHAFDHKIYTPGNRREARRRLTFPEDAFILASVATNKGPRKNYGNLLRAYRKFLDQVPEAWENAFLYLHCNVSRMDNPIGYELPQIWHGLGIAERIKYVHPVYYEAYGFTEQELADVYRSADYTVLVSLGEGFGLPAIESLGCGTPVIFSNFSSLPEVVGPGGLPVDATDRIPFELSSSFQWIPSTEQITKRMVEAYKDWQEGGRLRDELGKRGRRHVLRNYTWDRVMPSWLKLIEGERLEPIELPARKPKTLGEVDIILLTWNGLELLTQCVESIYSHTSLPFHLIIVDDLSTDGTKEYVDRLWNDRDNLTYIRPETKAKGGSEIMNRGFKRCRNDLIVSMNNDIVVTEGWLEEAVDLIEKDPKIGIVGMKFLWPWDNRIQQAGGTFIKGDVPCHIGAGEPGDAHSETNEVLWASGPCVLLRRQALEPGWDEDYDSFGGHEDVDLCLRARSKGWKVVYCGKSVVYHNEGATVLKLPGFSEMFERNRILFSSKWRGSPLLSPDSVEGSR